MNILFVCSRNKWRSKTAEEIYKNNGNFICKSAGTEPSARIRINAGMINWADLIFVMENKHKKRLAEKFEKEIKGREIIVLDIEDNYQYMDPELIELIKSGVDSYLE